MSIRQLLAVFAGSLVIFLLTPVNYRASAQSPTFTQDELEKAIKELDTTLFDAYNRCDLGKFSGFFADDLELYHDQDGVVSGRRALTDNVKTYVCGGDVRRELVPGTLRVHRIEGYGAVCTGVHRFRRPKSKTPASERRFVNLWRFKDGVWMITRVISYADHGIR